MLLFPVLLPHLDTALNARKNLLEHSDHSSALRLFNGFYEGCPDLAIDIYASCAVIFNYAKDPEAAAIEPLVKWLQSALPWLTTVLVKTRNAADQALRNGVLAAGQTLPDRFQENGIWYALDLTMNQDASFYLDTRALRAWLKENSAGKSVLNTFAYTGSLGTAALAGGAARVVQTDLSRRFLSLAKTSYAINHLPFQPKDLMVGDFYPVTARLRAERSSFDCVILDPPFFSETREGRIDLQTQYIRLVNKVRPLISHGGRLVAVNNALFLSGQAYLNILQTLCADGYMTIEETIPVPTDFFGTRDAIASFAPVDPSPFNHPTKIVIIRVQKKGLPAIL